MEKGTIRQMVLGDVGTNCYFLVNKETREMILIDPADEESRILAFAEAQGYHPAAILLTHGHFDHILAVNDLRDEWDVSVYAEEHERETLQDPRRNLSGLMGGRSYVTAADGYFADGDEVELAGFPIRVIHTPGHTEGSCCFYLEEEKVLFSGDTLFEGSCGRTDFPGGSMTKIVRSIQDKLFVLPEDVLVYPGHGDCTTIGEEKRYNYVAGM